MKRYKKLLWVVGVLGMLVGATYWFTPDIVRWYVHDTYAGVVIHGAVEIDWLMPQAVFHDVEVKRTGIRGRLTTVSVNKKREVYVDGGKLRVDLDQLGAGEGDGEGESAKVIAAGLDVEVIKKGVQASANKTTISPTAVCFETGSVTYQGYTATVREACLKRDKSVFKAQRVEVPFTLPFDLPRMDREQMLVVTEIEADLALQLVRFDSAEIQSFTAKGPATIKYADDTVFFDAVEVEVNHPWVAPHPVHFNRVGVTAPTSLLKGEGGKLRITLDRATIHIDPLQWEVYGEDTCNDWITAMPQPLPEALQQAAGNFDGQLQFHVRAKPTPHLSIDYDCKFKCSEEPIKSLRRSHFTYLAYDSKGELFERESGYQTANWVSLADLPPHVPEAFRLMEDPGFHSHQGIHVMALVNSLKANLKKGRFVKGGSTITMQTAKNLWLRRHKTIGRKAQEAMLTIALESCLGKARIMELYMNIVEYAPDVYGLRAASQHYFHKDPSDLAADEAFFLASVLPNPKKVTLPQHGGMERVHRIMTRLATSGYISEYLIPAKEEEVDTTGWDTLE